MQRAATPFLVPLLLLLGSASFGCQGLSLWWNPTTGYEAVGTPELDFEQAKAICEEKSEFDSFSGSSQVDWTAFEQCMKAYDWVRPQS